MDSDTSHRSAKRAFQRSGGASPCRSESPFIVIGKSRCSRIAFPKASTPCSPLGSARLLVHTKPVLRLSSAAAGGARRCQRAACCRVAAETTDQRPSSVGQRGRLVTVIAAALQVLCNLEGKSALQRVPRECKARHFAERRQSVRPCQSRSSHTLVRPSTTRSRLLSTRRWCFRPTSACSSGSRPHRVPVVREARSPASGCSSPTCFDLKVGTFPPQLPFAAIDVISRS